MKKTNNRKNTAPSRSRMNGQKKLAIIIAAAISLVLLIGSAFAFTDFGQSVINRFRGSADPGVLLHDDFEPGVNKDVYVENTGETPMIVRVQFAEYLQIGNYPIIGERPDDTATWRIREWTGVTIAGDGKIASTDNRHDWWTTGAQKVFKPGTGEIGNYEYTVSQTFPDGTAAKKTLPSNKVVSMSYYKDHKAAADADPNGCWILDDTPGGNGWAYWSKLLPAGEATNLLLDNVLIDPLKKPDDNYYYAIDVRLQASNLTEAYLIGENGGISEDGRGLINELTKPGTAIEPEIEIEPKKVTVSGPLYAALGSGIGKGKTVKFTADCEVEWSLAGTAQKGVSINAKTGEVTIAADAVIGKVFTVRGTLADGSASFGEASSQIALPVNSSKFPQSSDFFPDSQFRQFVAEEFDLNKDGLLSADEIDAATKIETPSLQAVSVKGIEYLTKLNCLVIFNGKISTIDLSKNTELTEIYLEQGKLTSLDVSKNTKLTKLSCYINPMTSLNVKGCTELTYLDCSWNNITELDVRNNTALTWLDCGINSLTDLDVSQNTALTRLECGRNKLSKLDVSKNTALTTLKCGDNSLTSLDLSKNTALTWLECDKNNLSVLDLSKNTALKFVNCSKNKITTLDISFLTSLPDDKAIYFGENGLTKLIINNTTQTGWTFKDSDRHLPGNGNPPGTFGAANVVTK